MGAVRSVLALVGAWRNERAIKGTNVRNMLHPCLECNSQKRGGKAASSFIHSFFALYFDPFPFIIETNQGHVCDAIDDKDYATGMDADDVKFNRIRVC